MSRSKSSGRASSICILTINSFPSLLPLILFIFLHYFTEPSSILLLSTSSYSTPLALKSFFCLLPSLTPLFLLCPSSFNSTQNILACSSFLPLTSSHTPTSSALLFPLFSPAVARPLSCVLSTLNTYLIYLSSIFFISPSSPPILISPPHNLSSSIQICQKAISFYLNPLRIFLSLSPIPVPYRCCHLYPILNMCFLSTGPLHHIS